MKKEFLKPEVEVIEIGMDVLTDTGATSSAPVMAFASPNINIDSQSGHDTTPMAIVYTQDSFENYNPYSDGPIDIYNINP